MRLTDKIRQRIQGELKAQTDLADDQETVDAVFGETLDQLDDHIKLIVTALVAQRVALGKRREMREIHKDSIDRQADNATIALNLNEMLFPADVDLMVKHLELIRPYALRKALAQLPPDERGTLRDIIAELEEEDDNA